MSELWRVEALSCQNNETRLRVQAVHPDSGAFPETKEFALQLLYDEAWTFQTDMTRVSRGPLAQAITSDQINDRAFQRENAARFIADVKIVDQRNVPLNEERLRDEIAENLSKQGMTPNDRMYKLTWQKEWNAFWSDPARVPTAVYVVTATSPEWLQHLKPGQTWDSAAF